MVEKKIKILAIIPARSGSKGVPDKNVKMFAGHPLIAHSIKQALSSKLITRTIVATDSRQYADIALEYGAEVPFLRTSSVSGDHSSDLETFQFMLKELLNREGYQPDIIVHLRPTSPLREVADIDAAINLLNLTKEADSVRSLVKSDVSPYKMWVKKGKKFIEPAATCPIKEAHSQPRQVLPTAYIHNGAIDVIKSQVIVELSSMTGSRVLPYIMSSRDDIDSMEDFLKAESKIS